MRCVHCGYQMADDAANCPNCGKETAPVSVLSPQEREAFDGVTIDQDGSEQSKSSERRQQRVYFRQVRIGDGNGLSGFVTLLLVCLLVVAFLFFAMPLIMLLLLAAAAIWLINRLFF